MKKRALTFFAPAIFSLAVLASVTATGAIGESNSFSAAESNAELPGKNGTTHFPRIFRFNSSVAEETVKEFRSAYTAARASFQKSVEANFLLESLFQDLKLDANALASERFSRVISTFQRENKSFPLSRKLAETWATGGSDDALLEAWAKGLRAAMRHLILPVTSPEVATDSDRAVIIAVTNLAETISLETVSDHAKEVAATDFYTLEKATREMQLLFSNDRSVADFLGAFLKENCAYDAELTRQIFTPEIPLVSEKIMDEHVAKAGEVADLAIPAVQVPVASGKLAAPENGAVKFIVTHQKSARIALVGLALTLAVILVFRWFSKRAHRAKAKPEILPAFKTNAPLEVAEVISAPKIAVQQPVLSDPAEVKFWRDRALEAERRLENVSAAARPHLLPHLARLVKEQFVQRLFWQRNALLDTQEMATLKVAEMEKRLEKIQASRESQLQAYQLRIERLEKELAAKSEENRALIQTAMQLTKTVQMTNVE